jgi:2-aminoadipate transaminase
MPEAQLPLSRRSRLVKGSAIRALLKTTQQPDVISLGGGMPAPAAFPLDAMREAFDAEIRESGAAAVQYSMTEGETVLRDWVAEQETAKGIPTSPENVMAVSGSQQALDLIAKAWVEPGAPVLVESPTYLGALQAFSAFEPDYRIVTTDENGFTPETVASGVLSGARFMYAMTNFQNPTGRTLTEACRRSIAQAARSNDFWLLEDDPYGELWYRTPPPPGLRKFAPERTIRMGSFSKILAPGLRVGFIVGPEAAIELLARLKQATDLQAGTLVQRAAIRALRSGLLETHLPRIRAFYTGQSEAMLAALEEQMPEGVTWNRPNGGMFVWLTLPGRVDCTTLLAAAVERGVVFAPGDGFYAVNAPRNTIRLSFSTVPPEKIRKAVGILAELIEAQR